MAGSSMRDIKRRIKSINSMEHITNAMKLVSACEVEKGEEHLRKEPEEFPLHHRIHRRGVS